MDDNQDKFNTLSEQMLSNLTKVDFLALAYPNGEIGVSVPMQKGNFPFAVEIRGCGNTKGGEIIQDKNRMVELISKERLTHHQMSVVVTETSMFFGNGSIVSTDNGKIVPDGYSERSLMKNMVIVGREKMEIVSKDQYLNGFLEIPLTELDQGGKVYFVAGYGVVVISNGLPEQGASYLIQKINNEIQIIPIDRDEIADDIEERGLRYTQELRFPGEEYYRAGDKIDGSIIYQVEGASNKISVDFEKDNALREFFDESKKKFVKSGEKDYAKFVSRFIEENIQYDHNGVIDGLRKGNTQKDFQNGLFPNIDDVKLRSKIIEMPPMAGEVVNLGFFTELRLGVCLEMGILLAACVERGIEKGLFPKYTKVEFRSSFNNPKKDGHAWAAMLGVDGQTWIGDPAHGRFGLEKDSTSYPYAHGYEKHIFGQAGT